MACVRCQVCNMYVDVDKTKAYSMRFVTGEAYHPGHPRLEGVELGGREPWAGIRTVCLDCMAFLRTLGGDEPIGSSHLRRLVESYVDSLRIAIEQLRSGGAPDGQDGGMVLQAVENDLRAILEGQEPRQGVTGPGVAQSPIPGPPIAPRGV
jgi:hypothetical protein